MIEIKMDIGIVQVINNSKECKSGTDGKAI